MRVFRFILLHAFVIIFTSADCRPDISSKPEIDIEVLKRTQMDPFEISMSIIIVPMDTLEMQLPVWTPGYYQIMGYPNNIFAFTAFDEDGQALPWVKKGRSAWKIVTGGNKRIRIAYKAHTSERFVANSFSTTDFTYIVPASLIMHPREGRNNTIKITVMTDSIQQIATAMEYYPLSKSKNIFVANGFDELYDSPILIGELEELRTFYVGGVPHYFKGYKLGDFDRELFINDLQKIVEAASNVIGQIPYKHYSFLAIGPGQGGIEHTNCTTVSFDGAALSTREGRVSMYSFLAHEYFHHYNVKRIRPIELGPFDYTKENRTRQLWVAEGITVYYDLIIPVRAGLCSKEELLNKISGIITSYESGEGKSHQTLAEASYNTWTDGPFGNSDKTKPTISVYQKGTIVAFLLDLELRRITKDEKSLDDVMRKLYREFYIKQQRGFTESEFRNTCEAIAGTSLQEIFDYVYTVTTIDYEKYLAPAGLKFVKDQSGKISITFESERTKRKAKYPNQGTRNEVRSTR